MPEYDNAAVAAILDDFAALLEIAGEDRYRFLSYHTAAQPVRAWDERISVTARFPSCGREAARRRTRGGAEGDARCRGRERGGKLAAYV